MGAHRIRKLLVVILGGMALYAQVQLPPVQERRLKNGVRILLVERPGSGALHAHLFLRGGQADTGSLPAVAADLLARSLFGAELGEPGRERLEVLLQREEGSHESLRLEQIRQGRQAGGDAPSEVSSLQVIHGQALERIRELAEMASRRDAWAEAGCGPRRTSVEADYIATGMDMPSSAFEAWCRLEGSRLRRLQLGRFPVERERMLLEAADPSSRSEHALSLVLGTALTGSPYAQVDEISRAAVDAITWTELRHYARSAAAPDRMILVLVGDISWAGCLPPLERTFGLLPSEEGGGRGSLSSEAPGAPGARRLQASTAAETRLFMGWRLPPLGHADQPVLHVLAQLLGGGPSSRLQKRVVEERKLARSLEIRMGVPGARETNLLLVDARPALGRGLVELEQAIQSEIFRLQRESIPAGELRRAQRQLEADQLKLQEDGARLAQALGAAFCQGGDWRLAFPGANLRRDISQEELQAIANTYLMPTQTTTVLLEPDPVLRPQDHLESQLLDVLKQLLRRKVDDPAQVDAILRESLRQLRMLSTPERMQALKLLEAQLKP